MSKELLYFTPSQKNKIRSLGGQCGNLGGVVGENYFRMSKNRKKIIHDFHIVINGKIEKIIKKEYKSFEELWKNLKPLN